MDMTLDNVNRYDVDVGSTENDDEVADSPDKVEPSLTCAYNEAH